MGDIPTVLNVVWSRFGEKGGSPLRGATLPFAALSASRSQMGRQAGLQQMLISDAAKPPQSPSNRPPKIGSVTCSM